MEDDGQVLLCVEISGLLAATEVSVTVSLKGVSSGKAGMKDKLIVMVMLTKFILQIDHITHYK